MPPAGAVGRQARPAAALLVPAPPYWLAVTAVTAAALIWSSSFAITKLALRDTGPLTIGALRFAGATVLLAVAVRLRVHGAATRPDRRQRLLICSAGLLGITAYFAVENIGVDLASASDAALIVASYPLITLVLELVLRQAAFSAVQLLGMLLAAGGVWLVVDGGATASSAAGGAAGGSGGDRLLGSLVLLAGGVVWAAYNLLARLGGTGASPVLVTYYQTAAGAAGFALLSLTEVHSWSVPSRATGLGVAYLAVFCSGVAFALYNYGLTALSSAAAVNLLNVVPAAGLLWAVLLAGEQLVLVQVLGGAVVVLGVSLSTVRTGSRRRREAAAPSQQLAS